MTKSALIYAWAIVAIGVSILIGAAFEWQSSDATAFGVCLALALFASTLKIKLNGLTETLSPGFVFLLISIAMLSWSETIVIGVASGLAQCLWRPKRTPSGLQIGFAAGTMAISGGLTYTINRFLVVMRGPGNMAIILGVAGVVLLVTNTLIVATVLCLIKEAPFYTIWRAIQCRTVPYYLAGGVLADIWTQAGLTRPIGFALLAAISVYLLFICFRELDATALGRQEHSCPASEG